MYYKLGNGFNDYQNSDYLMWNSEHNSHNINCFKKTSGPTKSNSVIRSPKTDVLKIVSQKMQCLYEEND